MAALVVLPLSMLSGTELLAGSASASTPHLVGASLTRTGAGYITCGSDGGVFTHGDAVFHGSMGGHHLNQPVVACAEDAATGGYWLVAADGGVFSFDAPFYGSTGAIRLNQPIVGMAPTRDGHGYWLVASDGGIFSFGDARFYGSTGDLRLNRPIVAMASSPDQRGYWLAGSDGGIFSFGDARFHGSAFPTASPVVGMASTATGYVLASSTGTLYGFPTPVPSVPMPTLAVLSGPNGELVQISTSGAASQTSAASSLSPSPTRQPAPGGGGTSGGTSSGTTGGTTGGTSGTTGTVSPLGLGGSWNLKFDDEFNATTLDTSKWSTGWLASGVTPPVNTYEQECYDPHQVAESGGSLNLTVIASSCTVNGKTYPYRSGIVNSNGKAQFTYGYFESRIYLPGTSGSIANWPAFWTDGQNWPTDGEMDVMEGLEGQACWHFHSDAGGPGGCSSGNFTGWHTYGADWEPGSVTYYYDGAAVGTITTGITSAPMYLILNDAVNQPGDGVASAPSTMQVDYVRVWAKA